jgi:hypothetical protein
VKSMIIAGFALLLGATASGAAGINLSWTDCGTAGGRSASFACDANSSEPFVLVASFDPPSGVSEFYGFEAQLDIVSGATLPDWWRHGTAFCRGNSSLEVDFDFVAGPATCDDALAGQAFGGFAYDVEFSAPNRARMRVQAGVTFEQRMALAAGTEVYAFKTSIQTPKSSGTDACGGCSTEACIVLNSIQLYQPTELGFDPVIVDKRDDNHVMWQSLEIAQCPQSTAVHARTWGQVKSLYR